MDGGGFVGSKEFENNLYNLSEKKMESKISLGDCLGWGIGLGSIVGTIVGILLENPGAGWLLGMISGAVLGLLFSRIKTVSLPIDHQNKKAH